MSTTGARDDLAELRTSAGLANNNERVPGTVTSTADPRATRARRSWRAPLLVFLACFAVFGLTARHGGGSWDYYTANYATWNIVHTGDPWLEPGTVPGLEGDPEAFYWVRVADNGHTVVSRFPGLIAITMPAYWIAERLGLTDTMTVVPGAITAALACAVGLMLLFLAMRKRLGDKVAATACGILGFATPVWTISADATWPHTVTLLGICGMAWATASNRWVWAGVFGGVTLWGRLHAAAVVAVVGVLLGWWRRSPRITLTMGAISAGFLGLISVWTRWMYGSWDPIASYGSEDVLGYIPEGWDHIREELAMWIAPDRGIFVWTPVVALLMPALFRGWREVPDWARSLLFGGLAYTLIQGFMRNGIGGDSFYGYRLGIEFVVAATPALAFASSHMGRFARRLFVPLVTLQLCAFAFGAVVDVFLRKQVAWHDNAFSYVLRTTWPAGPVLVAAIVALAVVIEWRYRTRVRAAS
jgi:hypothetical protein